MTPHRSDVAVPLPDCPAAERASVAEEGHAAELVNRNHAGAGGDACPGAMDRRKRRGVEGHASQRRDGTGRWNPAQGFLVRGQRQRESVGTLIAPTQAGIEPGRRFLGSVDVLAEDGPWVW